MADTKLATFRVGEDAWQEFQIWAKANGSNASEELNRYILSCIGKDRVISTDIDKRIDRRIDDYYFNMGEAMAEKEDRLDARIDELKAELEIVKKL